MSLALGLGTSLLLQKAEANPCIATLHCQPRVAEAIADAWRDAAVGILNTEAGFCVLKKEGALPNSCDFEIDKFPQTNEFQKISFKLHPRCIAIFHTHPNSSSPEPSSNDRALALKSRRRMYTISNRGIYRYDSLTDKTTRVRDDADYSKPCAPVGGAAPKDEDEE